MYFDEFMSSRQFGKEDIERRRMSDYAYAGSTAAADKQAYVSWLELKLKEIRNI